MQFMGPNVLVRPPLKDNRNQPIQVLYKSKILYKSFYMLGWAIYGRYQKIRPNPWPQVPVCLGRQDSVIKEASALDGTQR